MFEYIDKLKQDTNNLKDIIIRKRIINNTTIYIIYNEPLVNSNSISNYIIKSLTKLTILPTDDIINKLEDKLYNFKITKIHSYIELCEYLHLGYTIILSDSPTILALETKSNLNRSISTPHAENTIRGAKDSFIEDYQTNIGLIKKRIKSNNLWIKNIKIGKYTNTNIGIVYIKGICKDELVNIIEERLNNIIIDGIINSGTIKNLIEKENKSPFPTTLSTERPEKVASELLSGKICIVIDNDPYVLIIPAFLNDFIKYSEDYYSKSINASFTRIIRFIAFLISLFTPALYIALITYNQEMIPTIFLISFSIQRSGVPFPAFIEAFIMMIAFEILREADLRTPSFTGSSLSIVGALILGDAAVNAGIVSPIMIIVIALTSISSLLFSEYELTNSLRYYRIIFMLSAASLGLIGLVLSFIYFLINICSLKSYGKSYLLPYNPFNLIGFKDSIIKFTTKSNNKRPYYLSNNKKRGQNEN